MGLRDWRAELAPHYAEARRVLGATTYDEDDPPTQPPQASKSTATASPTGKLWQVSTKPASTSAGSRA